jgi:anaerobic ribonucleoside-triphosphate reductase
MKKQKVDNKALEAKRQPCEVFSRIVGYLRPVQQWNDGKAAEFDLRKEYKIANF